MVEKEVLEFKGDNKTKTITTTNPEVEKSNSTVPKSEAEASVNLDHDSKVQTITKPPKSEDLKSFDFMGVKFPPYFVGPHFVQIKGSFVMAINPSCVSMEMRTNWVAKYVPELAALGKKVLEKNLHIKIETLD